MLLFLALTMYRSRHNRDGIAGANATPHIPRLLSDLRGKWTVVRRRFRRQRKNSPPPAIAPQPRNDVPYPVTVQRARPVNLPRWMTQPTVGNPQVGRVGWLTPAQQWRANGGRW